MKAHLLQMPSNADSSKWVKKECLQCGISVYVRICYEQRGQGRFCSVSCGATYNNRINNSAKKPDVRAKIRAHHADVSGRNNPMFGVRGPDAPGYIDGRNAIPGDIWRKIALLNKPSVCEECGEIVIGRRLHVHHKDKSRKNNELDNLQIVCVRCHNTVLHERQRDDLGRYI